MYSRILVPCDGSEPSLCGLRQAIALAKEHGSTLVLLNVVDQLPLLMGQAAFVNYGEVSELLARAGHEVVDHASQEATRAGVACECQVIDGGAGPASDVIVAQAAAQHCELIVIGTHGRRGLKRLTLGSDAELVVRHAPVPVLLVKVPAAAAG